MRAKIAELEEINCAQDALGKASEFLYRMYGPGMVTKRCDVLKEEDGWYLHYQLGPTPNRNEREGA